MKYTIDLREVQDREDMHFLFKDVLDFPDYYGCNWSALWDCLTDMYGDPIHIEIIGLDAFEERCHETKDTLIRILKRFKHYIPRFEDDVLIELVDGDRRVVVE